MATLTQSSRGVFVTIAMSVLLVGCAAPVPVESGPMTSTAQGSVQPTSARTALPAAETLLPTFDQSDRIVEAARSYVAAAGFKLLTDVAPRVGRHEAGYEPSVLWEVTFALAGADGASVPLRIYLDDGAQIRMVDDDLGFPEPSGPGITRSDALDRAGLALRLVGLDAPADRLSVSTAIPGREWIILLGRSVDGYPVANHWASSGLAGDRAWVTLRGDGALVELYAIQPSTAARPAAILPPEALTERLALVAGLSGARMAALAPHLTWIRALDAQGAEASILTLSYCATQIMLAGWEAWCVDAGTGEKNAHGLGAD